MGLSERTMMECENSMQLTPPMRFKHSKTCMKDDKASRIGLEQWTRNPAWRAGFSARETATPSHPANEAYCFTGGPAIFISDLPQS